MTTAVIIQARMGSKRFPGKILAKLGDKTVLGHVVARAKEIGPRVIVATDAASERHIPTGPDLPSDFFIGPGDDVLLRYLKCAEAYHIDIIMRITADCPLLDPELCKKVLAMHMEHRCFCAIAENKTFPKGYGCEVFSRRAIELANEYAKDDYDREHVTSWMERNLRCIYLTQEKDESHLNYCVDYPEDIPRLEAILDARAKSR